MLGELKPKGPKGALPKRGLITTGLGRVQAAKKSNVEVDVGTTWPGASWLGPQRSFVFRPYLLLVLRWAWGSCGFNTKHHSTKAPHPVFLQGRTTPHASRKNLARILPVHAWTGKIPSNKGLTADPVYGRAKCLPMLGEIKTQRT